MAAKTKQKEENRKVTYDTVYLRLTKEQKLTLRELAKDNMLSMTAFLRHVIKTICNKEVKVSFDAPSKPRKSK